MGQGPVPLAVGGWSGETAGPDRALPQTPPAHRNALQQKSPGIEAGGSPERPGKGGWRSAGIHSGNASAQFG
jgi:hypothetical protein